MQEGANSYSCVKDGWTILTPNHSSFPFMETTSPGLALLSARRCVMCTDSLKIRLIGSGSMFFRVMAKSSRGSSPTTPSWTSATCCHMKFAFERYAVRCCENLTWHPHAVSP